MLYPANWKKITVDQSKVLKNRLYRLFRFWGATRYKRSIQSRTAQRGSFEVLRLDREKEDVISFISSTDFVQTFTEISGP